jgi:acetyl esterase
VVIGVDYRLAPEHRFPLPINDCYEALNWVFCNSKQYMIDPSRVAVWGCSAGGNLAASITLRDSVENEVSRIRHVNLVVPATCHPSLHPPILQSSNASMNALRPDNTSSEEAMAAILKLWGEPHLLF